VNVPHYRRVGDVPRKRHTLVKRPGGDGYLAEELIGQEGFAQESALLYHHSSPSAIVSLERVDDPSAVEFSLDAPLVPRHFRTPELPAGGDPVLGRRRLLGNDDVVLSFVSADQGSDLYRNAVGDELAYVHAGEATLLTSFGELELHPGDYVVVPAGVTHRWVLRSDHLELLVFEAHGHVRFPDRYLTDRGQLREGAPFSERDVRAPIDPLVVDGDEVPVLVRTKAGLTRMVHAHHPFDVIGWDGCLYPHALSIHDFEPIVGAIHQPPPVHQTFAGPGFVVCSFVPRPYDFHPDATKVPYHHANVDSDEVLFYAAGDFMSRAGSGIGVGSISWHPPGFVHGPQPGSVEAAMEQTRTEELAVMMDTFRSLHASDLARSVADENYAWSWARES
jgi:homogentisate 1,2-dioxygenase